MTAERPVAPLTAEAKRLRQWVLNEAGVTGEGAWTAEFDRRLRLALAAARSSPEPSLREAALALFGAGGPFIENEPRGRVAYRTWNGIPQDIPQQAHALVRRFRAALIESSSPEERGS